MKMIVSTIPHKTQRYDTCGDWFFDESGNLHVNISSMGDWRCEALVAVHEIVEALLCKARNIPQHVVDAFDKRLIAENYQGEPGDHPQAPYHAEHCFATAFERMLCAALAVDWEEYAVKVEAL